MVMCLLYRSPQGGYPPQSWYRCGPAMPDVPMRAGRFRGHPGRQGESGEPASFRYQL
ncbi:hypothetical protein DOJK_01867 [Patescibacteria group bacterium]|nr:hypothetical protein DOJK_01867 [Patescibacteria group bacterium]